MRKKLNLLTVGYISHTENMMPMMHRNVRGQTNIRGIIGQQTARNPLDILKYHSVI